MKPTISITGDGNSIGDSNANRIDKKSVTSGVTMTDFNALLGQLHGLLGAAELDTKTRSIVQNDLDVVEKEANDKKPSGPIIVAVRGADVKLQCKKN